MLGEHRRAPPFVPIAVDRIGHRIAVPKKSSRLHVRVFEASCLIWLTLIPIRFTHRFFFLLFPDIEGPRGALLDLHQLFVVPRGAGSLLRLVLAREEVKDSSPVFFAQTSRNARVVRRRKVN